MRQGEGSFILNKNYATASELVYMHMDVASMLLGDEVQLFNEEQQIKYLAFQLGVIEYFHQSILASSEDLDPDSIFFNFLFACAKYGKSDMKAVEAVSKAWKDMAISGLYFKERQLGFDSVNNEENEDGSRRDGHFSGSYLMKAVSVDGKKRKPSSLKLVSKGLNAVAKISTSTKPNSPIQSDRLSISASEYARISGKERRQVVFELMTSKSDGFQKGDDWYIYIDEDDLVATQLKDEREISEKGVNWWGVFFIALFLIMLVKVVIIAK